MKDKKKTFLIYLDRLEEEGTLLIEESVSPSILELSEEGVRFIDLITVRGNAYFANEFLMLTLVIKATAQIPCSICNQQVSYPIVISDFLHAEERSNLSSEYNYEDEIRTSLLLKLPQFIECQQVCPERKEIEKYLTSSAPRPRSPFADL